MHKSLNADNTPIGWIEICLGPDLMFQKMPITVLSARLNIKKVGRSGYVADEELTGLAALEWPIWHVGGFGWLLLSL